jgi:hypothetical protein
VKRAQTILSVPLVFAALMFLGGCRLLGPGYIGPVHPPPLDVPVQVSDLRAIEYGDEIIAGLTIPNVTTEGLELKSLRSVDLYAGPSAGADEPNSWYRTATHYTVPASVPGAFERRFPAQAWIGKDVVLRVRSTGPKGKISLWSLPFTLNVIAPLERPTDLQEASQKDGVHLTWRGAAPRFRILRAGADGMFAPLKDTDKPEYIDDSAQFGMSYQYMVQALANEKDDKQQSLASDPIATPVLIDTFAPEAPAGLTAAPGVNTIDLEWERNTEADFKGYNVFRSVDGGPFELIAPLINAPTYSDMNVQPGKTYRYQISSVDLVGNESARSQPVQAALP